MSTNERPPVCGVIYWTEAVDNTERRFGSDTRYIPFHVVDEAGFTRPAAMTRAELNACIARGHANPEDISKPAGALRRALAWLLR